VRCLVTGADGFVGQWLLRELLAHGGDVTGMTRGDHTRLTTLPTDMATQVRWLSADVLDADAMLNVVSEAKPDAIYHLAAQASVAESLRDPTGTVKTNVMGTANLLEATRANAPSALVVAVGSAEVYGSVEPAELPLRESAPLHPNNPYAGSKAAAEAAALQYAQSGWTRALVTRSFNHTGPGQSVTFAAAAFAKQCADIARGKQAPVLQHGNLSAQRDFLDVRDVVSAYRHLGEHGEPGAVYNVCSGRAISMREIVEELTSLVGVPVELRQDPKRMRPVDTPVVVGDPSRIQRDTAWRPEIPLLRTLRDLYDYFLKEDG